MWATLLKHRYYSIYGTYLDQIEPTVRAALAAGTPLQIPARNRLKAVQPDLTDEDGNMIPFCSLGYAEVQQGKERANTSTAKNIQVIPLRGVMEKDGGFCSYGTKDVKAWIDQANADPNIDSIVLYTDSPGGSVDGTEELAQTVKDSAKPVIAFVDGLAASAAVWVVSQCKEIVINQETTAWIGSIGVLATLINKSEAFKKEGYEVQIIRDSSSPNKAKVNSIETLDDDTRATLVADLDNIKSTFVSYVKKGRGDKLKGEGHFNGDVWNGKEGVKNGLADKIGTLQDAVNLAAKYAGKKESNPNNSNNKNKMKVNANVTPMLATALSFSAQTTEAEIEESNLVALENHLSAQATALTTAQSALSEAIKAKETAEASVKASEKELVTLKEWKKNAAIIEVGADESNNDGEKPEPVSAHMSQAYAAATAAKARAAKKK